MKNTNEEIEKMTVTECQDFLAGCKGWEKVKGNSTYGHPSGIRWRKNHGMPTDVFLEYDGDRKHPIELTLDGMRGAMPLSYYYWSYAQVCTPGEWVAGATKFAGKVHNLSGTDFVSGLPDVVFCTDKDLDMALMRLAVKCWKLVKDHEKNKTQ